MNIYEKLSALKNEIKPVKKDKTNPHFKNQYATLSAVIDTIQPLLEKHKLNYYQTLNIKDGIHYLTTILFNVEKTDDILSIEIPLFIEKNDMQKLGSALTYARRYGLITLLGLEQEDDDGNSASGITNNFINQTYNPSNSNYNNTKTKCSCGGDFVEKTTKEGRKFLGCSNFTNGCKNTKQI